MNRCTLLTQLRDAPLKISRETGKPSKIEGYGAVFYREGDPGTEYWLWNDMVERVMPTAFDRAVRDDDVRSFFNHDPNIVLGRKQAGTLRLSIDNRGLLYEVMPPDSQICRDQVMAPIERRDVTGSSFMFNTRKVVWIEEARDGQTVYIRELHDVELWEVGPVVFPAYEATSTGVRSGGPAVSKRHAELAAGGVCLRSVDHETARAELKAWLAQRESSRRAEADRVDLQFAEFRRREAELRLDELRI